MAHGEALRTVGSPTPPKPSPWSLSPRSGAAERRATAVPPPRFGGWARGRRGRARPALPHGSQSLTVGFIPSPLTGLDLSSRARLPQSLDPHRPHEITRTLAKLRQPVRAALVHPAPSPPRGLTFAVARAILPERPREPSRAWEPGDDPLHLFVWQEVRATSRQGRRPVEVRGVWRRGARARSGGPVCHAAGLYTLGICFACPSGIRGAMCGQH